MAAKNLTREQAFAEMAKGRRCRSPGMTKGWLTGNSDPPDMPLRDHTGWRYTLHSGDISMAPDGWRLLKDLPPRSTLVRESASAKEQLADVTKKWEACEVSSASQMKVYDSEVRNWGQRNNELARELAEARAKLEAAEAYGQESRSLHDDLRKKLSIVKCAVLGLACHHPMDEQDREVVKTIADMRSAVDLSAKLTAELTEAQAELVTTACLQITYREERDEARHERDRLRADLATTKAALEWQTEVSKAALESQERLAVETREAKAAADQFLAARNHAQRKHDALADKLRETKATLSRTKEELEALVEQTQEELRAEYLAHVETKGALAEALARPVPRFVEGDKVLYQGARGTIRAVRSIFDLKMDTGHIVRDLTIGDLSPAPTAKPESAWVNCSAEKAREMFALGRRVRNAASWQEHCWMQIVNDDVVDESGESASADAFQLFTETTGWQWQEVGQ